MKCNWSGCTAETIGVGKQCIVHRDMKRVYAARWRKKRTPETKARIRSTNATSKRRYFFNRRAYHFNWKHGSKITAKQLASLWRKQRGLCALTGWPLTREAHLDHAIPLALGGLTTIDNLRWLCATANRAKWNMLDSELLLFCHAVISNENNLL
jgi:5-methylcytosine-specific restriction endonuclease McrA